MSVLQPTEIVTTGSGTRSRSVLSPNVWILLCGALALSLAFLLSDYTLFQLTMVAVYAIAIVGLILVTGLNGQISLGHGAFYAIGAYTSAIGMFHYGMPYWVTLPLAAVVCGILGVCIGLPALRFEGVYLALITFTLAVVTPQVLKHPVIESWTGGVQGLFLDKPNAPFGLPITQDQWIFLFSTAMLVLVLLFVSSLMRSSVGRAVIALREHPVAASAMGVHTSRLKTQVFAISGMITGVAGALGAIAVQYVAPDSFPAMLSIMMFAGMLVGGLHSLAGAVLGGIFMQFVPNVADAFSKEAPDAVSGVILIAMILFMPAGLAGLPARVLHILRRR
jgi:branched-chain amino acid transport system permease protein